MTTPQPLLVVTLAVVAGAALSAQRRRRVAVRITSPVDDGYVSGLVRLVAVIEPAAAARQVKEVVFLRGRPQGVHGHARAVPM